MSANKLMRDLNRCPTLRMKPFYELEWLLFHVPEAAKGKEALTSEFNRDRNVYLHTGKQPRWSIEPGKQTEMVSIIAAMLSSEDVVASGAAAQKPGKPGRNGGVGGDGGDDACPVCVVFLCGFDHIY